MFTVAPGPPTLRDVPVLLMFIPVTGTGTHGNRRNSATLCPACQIAPTRSSFVRLSVKSGRFVRSGQNGTRILKFYLHISPEEQLKRFKQRLEDNSRHWKISESDYLERELWPQYVEAYEDVLALTSTERALVVRYSSEPQMVS